MEFNNISRIKDKNIGKKCFIIANGPSINDLDLSLLSNETIISMNASPIIEDKFNLQSDYYVVSDTRFLNVDNKKQIALSKIKDKSVCCVFRKELKDQVSIQGKNNYFIPSLSRDGFSKNIAGGFYFGCTTTMLAIQLAYYIGSSEIYLLGVDLDYSGAQARFYHEENPSPIDDNNSVQIFNIRNSYNILNELGVKIFSCSKNSLLRPYVPYRKFSEIFR